MSKIFCADCERILETDINECPTCGSNNRNIRACDNAKCSVLQSAKIIEKDNSGFKWHERLYREKISTGTKRKAREIQLYDRSDPQVTTKIHFVEEENEFGLMDVKHIEKVERPAKRRPKPLK